MDNISNNKEISSREIFYFRQRLKNKIFQSVLAYFNDSAKNEGLTKKDIARLLDKDPAQITRWFSGPNNWTLDTISDLLLAMDAEIEHEIIPLHDNKYQFTTLNVVKENSAEQAAYPSGAKDLFFIEVKGYNQRTHLLDISSALDESNTPMSFSQPQNTLSRDTADKKFTYFSSLQQ